MNICTICDINYLPKALCLLSSIDDKTRDYKMHWLCIDDQIYDKLSELNFKNVVLYRLSYLEEDPDLYARKIKPFVSEYGDARANYIWSLTPYFIQHLLQYKINAGEYLMYCDADIMFYQSPQIILDAVQGCSVGIHTHRFSKCEWTNTGHYNIGVVVFRKDEIGMYFSRLWKGWLLDPNNGHAEQYGTAGDQKYMELIEMYLKREDYCVFDEEAGINHGAPWCADDLDGKQIAFYHFSHFNMDEGSWRDSYNGEWAPAQWPWIRPLYEQYFELQLQHKKMGWV